MLPEGAVAELQGKNFVWVIDQENKANERPVTVGETIGNKLLIEEGLKVGDRVVVEGSQKLRAGVVVQAKPVSSAAQPSENLTKTE
jgi:membrane fusion protein (multidrug efflux system)